MKCKHCGQEIKERINLDRLKSCNRREDIDDLISELCEKGCPYKDICADSVCNLVVLQEWLFKEQK